MHSYLLWTCTSAHSFQDATSFSSHPHKPTPNIQCNTIRSPQRPQAWCSCSLCLAENESHVGALLTCCLAEHGCTSLGHCSPAVWLNTDTHRWGTAHLLFGCARNHNVGALLTCCLAVHGYTMLGHCSPAVWLCTDTQCWGTAHLLPCSCKTPKA